MAMAGDQDDLGHGLRCHQSGRLAEAEELYRRVLKLQPNHARANQLLGILCSQTDRCREAVELLERAVTLDPRSAASRCNLGMVLTMLSRHTEAIRELRGALELEPNFPEALRNLANALHGVGRIEEAIDCVQRSLMLKADSPTASHLLTLLHFLPSYDSRRLYQAHVAWRKTYADPLKGCIEPHSNERNPGRPLRIGYVAPEFGAQPLTRFLLPLLQGHNRAEFEIYCYSDTLHPDAVTQEVEASADQARNLRELSDRQAAELIRRDQIDILVDLAMHTHRNRLLVFAQKPAPVQVTYLAYPGTTGLDTIDYRFTDAYLDPPGQDESVYSEKSVRLTSFWCYRAPPEAPAATAPLPAQLKSFVTFGCLNNYAKVTHQTLDLWTDVLARVEQSRLMIHCAHGEPHTRSLSHMMQRGIDAGRITFVPPLHLAEYFHQYDQVDIALDPFPWPGGTTSCEALWMGVPVVTLAGQTAVSRGGVSILSNVGLPDLIARSPEQYVHVASELAQNVGHLSELRATLRQRMSSSPLMDAGRFTREVEPAYRQMWRTWCASHAG